MSNNNYLTPVTQETTYFIVHPADKDPEDNMLVLFNICAVNQEKYGIAGENTDYAVFSGIRKRSITGNEEKFSPEALEYFYSLFDNLEPKRPYNAMSPEFKDKTSLERKYVKAFYGLTSEQMETFKPTYNQGFQAGAFAVFEEDLENIFMFELRDDIEDYILERKGE